MSIGVQIYSWSWIQFHWSTCQFLCQYHAVDYDWDSNKCQCIGAANQVNQNQHQNKPTILKHCSQIQRMIKWVLFLVV